MDESSRESYQKLGDPGDEKYTNTKKKCNKKCLCIIFILITILALGGALGIILVLLSKKKCDDGYFLPDDNESECVPCSAHCKKCSGNEEQSKCSTCFDGYSLDGDICVNPYSIKGEYNIYKANVKINLINKEFLGFVTNMTIDGETIDKLVSEYEFNNTGNHIVYYVLKDDNKDLNNSFNEVVNLSSVYFSEDFDTKSITNMNSMFNGCSSLTSANLGNVFTTKVEDMDQMFYGCGALLSVDISNFASNDTDVKLFDGLPENGTIKVSNDFLGIIRNQIPESWEVVNAHFDIYNLLEN